jgi:hypothetical protein
MAVIRRQTFSFSFLVGYNLGCAQRGMPVTFCAFVLGGTRLLSPRFLSRSLAFVTIYTTHLYFWYPPPQVGSSHLRLARAWRACLPSVGLRTSNTDTYPCRNSRRAKIIQRRSIVGRSIFGLGWARLRRGPMAAAAHVRAASTDYCWCCSACCSCRAASTHLKRSRSLVCSCRPGPGPQNLQVSAKADVRLEPRLRYMYGCVPGVPSQYFFSPKMSSLPMPVSSYGTYLSIYTHTLGDPNWILGFPWD